MPYGTQSPLSDLLLPRPTRIRTSRSTQWKVSSYVAALAGGVTSPTCFGGEVPHSEKAQFTPARS